MCGLYAVLTCFSFDLIGIRNEIFDHRFCWSNQFNCLVYLYGVRYVSGERRNRRSGIVAFIRRRTICRRSALPNSIEPNQNPKWRIHYFRLYHLVWLSYWLSHSFVAIPLHCKYLILIVGFTETSCNHKLPFDQSNLQHRRPSWFGGHFTGKERKLWQTGSTNRDTRQSSW